MLPPDMVKSDAVMPRIATISPPETTIVPMLSAIGPPMAVPPAPPVAVSEPEPVMVSEPASARLFFWIAAAYCPASRKFRVPAARVMVTSPVLSSAMEKGVV